MRVLVLRQRDAVRPHAVVLGGPQQQAAPAGADVEEALALAQHQLAADVVELGLLRLASGIAGVAEVGARIDAPRVEPERVEVVRDVVVKLHLVGIGLGPVAQARPRQSRRRWRTQASGAGAAPAGSVGSPGISSAAAAISSRMPPSRSTLPST